MSLSSSKLLEDFARANGLVVDVNGGFYSEPTHRNRKYAISLRTKDGDETFIYKDKEFPRFRSFGETYELACKNYVNSLLVGSSLSIPINRGFRLLDLPNSIEELKIKIALSQMMEG